MDLWNIVQYLQHEQATLKQKYDQMVNIVNEIIKILNKEESKLVENMKKKSTKRCKFNNRGYCKEETSACNFLHANEVCEEYLTSGSCSLRRSCQLRHPWMCKYWLRGYCWRNNDCVFLHKTEDLGKESIKNTNTVEDDVETNEHDYPNNRTESESEESPIHDHQINAREIWKRNESETGEVSDDDFESIESIMTKVDSFELEYDDGNESEEETIEAILAKAMAFEFENSDYIESES